MSYFEITIDKIPFGWPGKPERCNIDDGTTFDYVPVKMKDRSLDEWVKTWDEHYGPAGARIDATCYLKISDSVIEGGGITFEIYALDDDETPIVHTGIPAESLGTLIEALQAIQRLRQAKQ